MTRYVVAGATGRVGSSAARELRNRQVATTVVVRDRSRAEAWERLGADVAVGSLTDRAFLTRILRGASGFLALLPENVAPADFHGTRRLMADTIAASTDDAGIPHVVLLSAVAAVLADRNGPAKDLHYCEGLLMHGRAIATVLRSAYYQDNVSSVLMPAMSQSIYPHFMASADAPFPMIATKDVGRFAADALLHPPARSETVVLLGPAYSVRDVAARLGAALGTTLQLVGVPPADHVAALVGAGVPLQFAEALAEMFESFANGLIVPMGDRTLMGTTAIDDVIADCLASTARPGRPYGRTAPKSRMHASRPGS